MKSKHQSLLILAGTALVATIAVAVSSTNNSALFDSLAGGIVHTSEIGRTLTLDNTTPIEVDGEGKGRVTLGNIAAYSPECSSQDGCFARIGNRGIAIYCPTAEKNGDYFKGFAGSKVDRIDLFFNGGPSSSTVVISWGKTDGTSITGYGTSVSNSAVVESSTLNQRFTYEYESAAVLKSQDTPKTAGCSCIYIYVKDSGETVDLVSLEVKYTCN